MASSANNRLTREQFKKQRELEELRKSGVAPAALDEDGKMINPHIPNYISQAPWYLNAAHPSLKHQKADSLPEDSDIHRYRRRGLIGSVAKGYRKGACQNCGAISHQAKDCVERPRKRGAALTNKNICPDEIVEQVDLSYDGKRDRWNGYDSTMYQEVIDHFKRTDEARLARKTAELEQAPLNGAKSDGSSDSDSDRDGSLSDEADDLKDTGVVIQKRDARTRTTVRNLRIREDRAKYLINLDVNSAYYDSKSRSMRENPHPNAKPDEVGYAGDNFVRSSGDIRNFTELASFAWEAEQKADPDLVIHPTAAPSQAEMLFKIHKQKKEEAAKVKKQTILGKYGGEEYIRDKAPVVAQSETYVEYSADGKLLKGAQPAKKRSKYHEDIHERGHTSVFGSFFQDGKWGYQCCHQVYRNAYCTGPTLSVSRQHQQTSDRRLDDTKRAAQEVSSTTLLKSDGPSEAELEEYHRNRSREFDPMADFINTKKSKKS